MAAKTQVNEAVPAILPPSGKDEPAGFPVVAIGASAGGLEAFERFFKHLPHDTGMAFILLPHLDPDRVSLLTEILQRSTKMALVQAEDGTRVEANNVYVIPPNRDMGIFHGELQLSLPGKPRGHRMPIDFFLRSLADDQAERAIGVILSGTGTDGTLGLRAIAGAGGLALVQEPESAKFSGMPASAIQAGYITHVLPVEAMPQALMLMARRLALGLGPAPDREDISQDLVRILLLLRSMTGHDFSRYKKSTIIRRIERRMSLHALDEMERYERYLRENIEEVQLLFKDLLINVTSFFRDSAAFEALRAEALPRMIKGLSPGQALRVWIAGCSTGEEAYSIAILLREWMDEARQEVRVQIYSTDLDDKAIACARAGIYPPNIAQDVSAERLRRFFTEETCGYRLKKLVRDMVVFAVQSVTKDPPFTKLNLISCRNLLIYLEPELQSDLISTFHFALRPGGVLLLSPSESIGDGADMFLPLDRKWKLYQSLSAIVGRQATPRAGLPWAATRDGPSKPPVGKSGLVKVADLVKRVLLESYAPASVVTDQQGNLLYVSGEMGKYLRPAPGHATLHIADMARGRLQLELRMVLHRIASDPALVLERDLPPEPDQAGDQGLRFAVRPLTHPTLDASFLLFSFTDVPKLPSSNRKRPLRSPSVPADQQRIEELESELLQAGEHLRSIVEEHQSFNEELQSANEELQSTNEELQSTNEELETSQEELQSVNDELNSVNAELHSKVDLLAETRNDMNNLLDNSRIGMIFLDRYLAIRRFTREARNVYRLADSDIGRPLADIKSNLEGDELSTYLHAARATLQPCEREVRTHAGASYLMRLEPYSAKKGTLEGLVISFTDITSRVEAEDAIRDARDLAEGIVSTLREPLLVLDGKLAVISASRTFYQYFRLKPAETIGHSIYTIDAGQWDSTQLRNLLEKVLPRGETCEGYVIERALPGRTSQSMLVHARRLVRGRGEAQLFIIAIEIPAPRKLQSRKPREAAHETKQGPVTQ